MIVIVLMNVIIFIYKIYNLIIIYTNLNNYFIFFLNWSRNLFILFLKLFIYNNIYIIINKE